MCCLLVSGVLDDLGVQVLLLIGVLLELPLLWIHLKSTFLDALDDPVLDLLAAQQSCTYARPLGTPLYQLWIFDVHLHHGSTHLDVIVLVLLQQHGLPDLHQRAKFGLVVLDVEPSVDGALIYSGVKAADGYVCDSDVGVVATAYSDEIRTVI